MTYLLEVAVCWAAFYLFYHVVLRRETFHRLNRWYLLGSAGLGLLIPAVELTLPGMGEATPTTAYLQPFTVGVATMEAIVISATSEEKSLDWWLLLTVLYAAGVAVTLARFFYGIHKIYKLYRASEKLPAGGYRFVRTNRPHSPFSFFRNLFWSDVFLVSEDDRRSIIRHEEAHIFQWHSLDVIALELLGAAFWCCPPVYWFKKAMKTTHEYLADAYVLSGADKKQYGRLLLRQSQFEMQIALSNSLFSSQLKQRIVMMTKTKSPQRAAWRYLAALPLMALLCLSFSFGEKMTSSETLFTEPFETLLPVENMEPVVAPQPVLVNEPMQTDSLPKGQAVFEKVDEMPRFSGCEDLKDAAQRDACAQQKLFGYLGENIKYPVTARQNKVEGMAVVSFVVQKDGSIASARIVKSVEAGIDGEALRVVKAMPAWTPGKKQGKPVPVEMKLPIRFALEAEEVAKPVEPAIASSKEKEVEVEEMPVFAGCGDLTGEERKKCSDEKLMQFIFDHLQYPKAAKESGLGGMVVAKFTIQADGSIASPEIKKSVGGGCDEEVLRVVGLMPKWSPAMQDGKPVAVAYHLPVKFKLDNGATSTPKAEKFEVFPNPAGQNGFDVRFKAPAGKVYIRFYDATNKGEVMEYEFTQNDGSELTKHIPVRGLFGNSATGTAFVALYDEKGNVLGSTTVVIQ